MNRKPLHTVCILLIGFLLTACSAGGGASSSRPTRTPRPDRTERPSHYPIRLGGSKMGDYHYRGFVQIPRGMTLGPDGRIYIADWNGRHIITIDQDWTMGDLGLWKDPVRWKKQGPHFVEFDSQGVLYIVSYGHILKVYPDGSTEDVIGHDTFVFGGVAIDDQDRAYYTERGEGQVFRITPEGEKDIVASDVYDAEGIAFGLDGTLYVGQSELQKVVKIDVDTGMVQPFFSWGGSPSTIFMTVDDDGDIWIRGAETLYQVSPEGVEKPFTIAGQEISGYLQELGVSGGIAFDEVENLWIAAYSSRILKLTGPIPGEEEGWAALETYHPGLLTQQMAVDGGDNVYVYNQYADAVWKLTPGGEAEAVLNWGEREGRVSSLAVGPEGILYLGMSNGEIKRLSGEGFTEHYADMYAIGMTFGYDGLLYAVERAEDGSCAVVRITGVDQVEMMTQEIDGHPLCLGPIQDKGNQFVKVDPAADQGLYLFDPSYFALFHLGIDGSGSMIREVHPEAGYGAMAVVVHLDSTVYHLEDTDYNLYADYPDGGTETLAFDLWGDPAAMAISRDGKWLFVAESGAVDKIAIR